MLIAEIKVFLRSTLLTGKLTSLHYSYDYHYYMEKHFRDNYHRLRDQGFSKGRVFETDCAALLPVLTQVMEVGGEHIRFYDLNTVKGKVFGWWFGVRKTPSVLISGNKFVGKEASLKALKEVINGSIGFE